MNKRSDQTTLTPSPAKQEEWERRMVDSVFPGDADYARKREEIRKRFEAMIPDLFPLRKIKPNER